MPSDREAELSKAYVAAVAAAAGYVTSVQNLDRDGIDLQIRAGGSMRPSLDIQLKATINLGDATNGAFRFPLKRRNYDLLREQTMIPRILVILDLPKNAEDWLSVTAEELVMRRCAYWASLADRPESDNKESVTISVQNKNRFDIEGLKALMQQSRRGALS